MIDCLFRADQHLVRLVRSEVSLIGTVDANYFAPVVLISVSAGIKGERFESWFDFAGLLDFGWAD